ncbi:MAG TPA: hypothetical protein VMI73_29650 [Trebonia sp.]|nr:hypothetical protein [Trebonia sp.]
MPDFGLHGRHGDGAGHDSRRRDQFPAGHGHDRDAGSVRFGQRIADPLTEP